MKRPAIQLYFGDLLKNPRVLRCSWGARGALIWTMSILHDSDEYGAVRWPLVEIAQAVGCPTPLIRELATKGALKGSDTRVDAYRWAPSHAGKRGPEIVLVPEQEGPLWYSSRMVRDEYKRTNRGLGTRFGQPGGGGGGSSGDIAKRAKVYQKNEGRCTHCKEPLGDDWEIDHLVPKSKGGTEDFENLMPSCRRCNQEKGASAPGDWLPTSLVGSHPPHTPTRANGDGGGSPQGPPTRREGAGASASSSLSTPGVTPTDTARATAGKVNGGQKIGLENQPRGAWRRDADAAVRYGAALGVHANPGESLEQLVGRIDAENARRARAA